MDTFETMQKADLVAHFPEPKVTAVSTLKAHALAQSKSPSLAKAQKIHFLKLVAVQASHLLINDDAHVTRFLNLGIAVSKIGGACKCHGMVLYICCEEDLQPDSDRKISRIFNDTRDFHFEHVPDPGHKSGEEKTPFTTWSTPSKPSDLN